VEGVYIYIMEQKNSKGSKLGFILLGLVGLGAAQFGD
jgi:hypothetical protein